MGVFLDLNQAGLVSLDGLEQRINTRAQSGVVGEVKGALRCLSLVEGITNNTIYPFDDNEETTTVISPQ